MDETIETPAPQASQTSSNQSPNPTKTYVDEDGRTMTVTTQPGAQIGNLAEVVARTGPDPVMLAAVVVFGAMTLTLVMYLVKRFQNQQERMIDHQQARSEADQTRFQDQLHRQRDEFRNELSNQRVAHLSELDRNSQMFERSLERIVITNKEGMENLSARLAMMDDRIVRVEAIVVSHFDMTAHRRRSDGEVPKQGVQRVEREIRQETETRVEVMPQEPPPQPPTPQLWSAPSGMTDFKVINTEEKK